MNVTEEFSFNGIRKAVLAMLRKGHDIENVIYMLRTELEGLEAASEYLEALRDADFAP